jgi:hypothetical protein
VSHCPLCGQKLVCPTCGDPDEIPPYVCPGCHAINGEPCAAWCPDRAIEEDAERRRDEIYDDDEETDDD